MLNTFIMRCPDFITKVDYLPLCHILARPEYLLCNADFFLTFLPLKLSFQINSL